VKLSNPKQTLNTENMEDLYVKKVRIKYNLDKTHELKYKIETVDYKFN
jgi:hypothetical protein